MAAKTLVATSAKLVGIQPLLDVDNTTLLGLQVQFNLQLVDPTGTMPTVGALTTFDAWSALDATQKTNMQDIRNTIIAAVIASYFT